MKDNAFGVLLKLAIVGWTLFCGWFWATGCFESAQRLRGQDTALGISVMIQSFTFGSIWFFPTIGAYLMYRLFGRSDEHKGTPPWAMPVGVLLIAGIGLYLGVPKLSQFIALRSAPGEVVSPALEAFAPTGVAEPSVEAPPQPRWHISTARSPMDDSPTVVLTVHATHEVYGWPASERPTLMVQCRENQTSVILLAGTGLESLGHGYDDAHVRLRFDSGRAKTQAWRESTTGQSYFAPNPIPLIREMLKHEQLVLEVVPYRSASQTIAFDLVGLREHIGRVQEACQWSTEPRAAPKVSDDLTGAELRKFAASLREQGHPCDDPTRGKRTGGWAGNRLYVVYCGPLQYGLTVTKEGVEVTPLP